MGYPTEDRRFAAHTRSSYLYTDGRRAEGNQWQWATSKATIQNFHWMNNQPNNLYGLQDCIGMKSHAGRVNWDDVHCESKMRAVCQYP